MEYRSIHLAPEEFSVGVTPKGTVSIGLGKLNPALGFPANVMFATELTPGEARAIAQLLTRKADEAAAAPC